jgi:ferredoxin
MVSPVAPTALSSNGTSATEEVAVVDEPDRDSEIASSVEDLGEPWIESPLCTTCNDCMDVNAQVFVYNEDKQAYIKDASAGTFAEIVLAAEACPARCIHPGSPLNPNEPNLDELVKRAAEFN